MKRIVCLSAFFLISVFCFGQSYKINNVSYDISGITREYALSQKVPVDTTTVFTDSELFEKYITNLRQLLNNQRVFQSTEVQCTYLEENENGVIPVDILIITQDTLNIIGFPYPSYNSNTGLALKIKVKDYNFFGSMEPMDFDINYQAPSAEQQIFGINFGFSVPFIIGKLPSSWNSSFGFEYTIGNPQMDMTICEGIGISVPIANITSLDFSFNQYYIQKTAYSDAHDDKYFKEEAGLSIPFTVGEIPNWAAITWTPSITFSYNWDADAFDGHPNSGIATEKLIGPMLSFNHTVGAGRINWIGNFRDGISASIGQTYNYNLHNNSETMNLTFNSQFHKKLCSFIGLSTREYWYKDFYSNSAQFGSMVRGIRDYDWESSDYILMNVDIPFKLFQTNWAKLFGWDKLNFIDFEFQVSPFLDIVLGENNNAGSDYKPKDGWYGAGMEMIVFPSRFRSIQGRVSFGVDAVQFLQKAGHKVSQLNGMADKIFNTGWRTGASSWYELSIGIGLFY